MQDGMSGAIQARQYNPLGEKVKSYLSDYDNGWLPVQA